MALPSERLKVIGPLAYAAAAVVAVILFWPRTFPLDDAYISLHNARSLLAGNDPLFGVNPLIGATSPVHLACLAGLGLFLPLPTAALMLSAIWSGIYVWGLWRLKSHWAFVALGLLSTWIPIHLLNGLETSMALAIVVWALVLSDSKWLGALLGLMPYVRPDLLFLAVPLGLRQLRIHPLHLIGLSLATALPFAIWETAATGLPFPNTATAKVIFFAEYDARPIWKLSVIARAAAFSLITPLFAGIPGLWRIRAGWCGLVYMGAILVTAYITLPGALLFNDYRYLAPFVPVLAYGLTAFSNRLLIGEAAVSFVAGGAALVRLHGELSGGLHIWFDAARAVSSLPAGSTVLVHDVGVVAWENPSVHLVDVVGLKSPLSTKIMNRNHVRPEQWGSALDQIARRSRAQYAVILEQQFWHSIGDNFRREGWTLTPVGQAGDFSVFRLTPPSSDRYRRVLKE